MRYDVMDYARKTCGYFCNSQVSSSRGRGLLLGVVHACVVFDDVTLDI